MLPVAGNALQRFDAPPADVLLCPKFSATGNLLPGSLERPDILICTTVRPGYKSAGSTVCTLNILGYMPLVSTITGLGRVLLGIVHTIVHLACAIFDQLNTIGYNYQSPHFQEAALGAKNIARGIVEAIPIVGNLAMLITDIVRARNFVNMDKERPDMPDIERYIGEPIFILSAYGEEIARRPEAQVTQAIEALNREPTLEDFNNSITTPNRIIFSTIKIC